MPTEIEIAGRKIGSGHPCFVIAEAGVNHNGSLEMARRLVDAAIDAGADAVKFQTFQASKLVSPGAQKAAYQLDTTSAHESQYQMLKRLELSESAHLDLYAYCGDRGILFISTPFDEDSADFLVSLGVAAIKIPSGEVTNLPFLRYLARKGLPLIVSTGMAFLAEVENCVQAIRSLPGAQLALLHCVSNYPARPADVNLRCMPTMSAAFEVPIGYSDHTLGVEVAMAAVALGAAIIEKHFTLDRDLPGPDHRASLVPNELHELVSGIRNVEAALGHTRKEPALSEADTASAARRSLVAARDISAGSVITEDSVVIRRPGTGLAPVMLQYVVGRTAAHDISAGTLLGLEMLH